MGLFEVVKVKRDGKEGGRIGVFVAKNRKSAARMGVMKVGYGHVRVFPVRVVKKR